MGPSSSISALAGFLFTYFFLHSTACVAVIDSFSLLHSLAFYEHVKFYISTALLESSGCFSVLLLVWMMVLQTYLHTSRAHVPEFPLGQWFLASFSFLPPKEPFLHCFPNCPNETLVPQIYRIFVIFHGSLEGHKPLSWLRFLPPWKNHYAWCELML